MNLVILDRDGVINEDSDAYVKSVAEWRPLPGALEAVARLNRAGYRTLIASNQSGLARGLMDYDALYAIHRELQHRLGELGGHIDGFFFCPHGPDEGCGCRKPRPGLLQDIAHRLQVDLTGVPVVGDSRRDLEAAVAAGAAPTLVRTGNGAVTERGLDLAVEVAVYDDLAAFADELLRSHRA